MRRLCFAPFLSGFTLLLFRQVSRARSHEERLYSISLDSDRLTYFLLQEVPRVFGCVFFVRRFAGFS